ncbi:hypothetical protein SRHO_G00038090 [Serrasalmus rhombeus]
MQRYVPVGVGRHARRIASELLAPLALLLLLRRVDEHEDEGTEEEDEDEDGGEEEEEARCGGRVQSGVLGFGQAGMWQSEGVLAIQRHHHHHHTVVHEFKPPFSPRRSLPSRASLPLRVWKRVAIKTTEEKRKRRRRRKRRRKRRRRMMMMSRVSRHNASTAITCRHAAAGDSAHGQSSTRHSFTMTAARVETILLLKLLRNPNIVEQRDKKGAKFAKFSNSSTRK